MADFKDEGWSCSSDDELDQQELEIALYSQIHFDSAQDENNLSAISLSKVPQYHIGLKELPVRITPIVRKQPLPSILQSDFLGFSNVVNECNDLEMVEESRIKKVKVKEEKVKNIQSELIDLESIDHSVVIDKSTEIEVVDNFAVEEGVIDITEETYNNSDLECLGSENCDSTSSYSTNKVESNNFKNLRKRKLILNRKAGEEDETHILKDSAHVQKETEREKKLDNEREKAVRIKELKSSGKERLAPYVLLENLSENRIAQMKCALKNMQYLSNAEQRVFQNEDKEDNFCDVNNLAKLPKKNCSASVKKENQDLCNVNNLVKLSKRKPDSLKVSVRKKSTITKSEAAIKPRKPPVRLRRGVTVLVKHYEDSDTNTDYSDSEASFQSTPDEVEKCTSTTREEFSHRQRKKERTETKEGDIVTRKKLHRNAKALFEEEEETSVKVEEICYSSNDSEVIECPASVASYCSEDNAEVLISSSSSSEDLDLSNVPDSGFDFNLTGGLQSLLKVPEPDTKDNWHIDEQDRHTRANPRSRYFCPKTMHCRNCKKEGHLSRDCTESPKRRCIFCGQEGHMHYACPGALCRNCDMPGHQMKECNEVRRDLNAVCARCWMTGHEEKLCPDKWRQYHITVDDKFLTNEKAAENPLKFCCNCGKRGHFGYECRLARMNHYVAPTYPFIAHYDTKAKNKKQKKAKRAKQKLSDENKRSESLKDHTSPKTHKRRKAIQDVSDNNWCNKGEANRGDKRQGQDRRILEHESERQPPRQRAGRHTSISKDQFHKGASISGRVKDSGQRSRKRARYSDEARSLPLIQSGLLGCGACHTQQRFSFSWRDGPMDLGDEDMMNANNYQHYQPNIMDWQNVHSAGEMYRRHNHWDDRGHVAEADVGRKRKRARHWDEVQPQRRAHSSPVFQDGPLRYGRGYSWQQMSLNWQDGPLGINEDIMEHEDFEYHQVSHNNWWDKGKANQGHKRQRCKNPKISQYGDRKGSDRTQSGHFQLNVSVGKKGRKTSLVDIQKKQDFSHAHGHGNVHDIPTSRPISTSQPRNVEKSSQHVKDGSKRGTKRSRNKR